MPGRRAAEGVPGDRRASAASCSSWSAATTASTRSSCATRSAPTSGPRRQDEFADRIGPAGYIGPVGADVPILLDEGVGEGGYVTGANRPDTHLRGVEPGRDFPFERVDVRTVEAGDTVDGHPIRIEPAIEIGNIFKLGTRYSEPLGATYLDTDGTAQPIVMGSYGIGPARIAAAAVEQFADEHGHLVAALARAVGRRARRARQGGHGRARARRAPLRRAGRDRPRRALRRPRRRPGREVRRRRAARRAAAPHGRAPHARRRASSRRRCGAAASSAACRSRARPRRRRTCGGASRRARQADLPAAVAGSTAPARRRPRRCPGSRCTRGRSRTRSATSGWR